MDPFLFIVAHEADVIRGPQAESAAMALEVRGVGKDAVAGDGLIKWDLMSTKLLDEEGQESEVNNAEAVWVDRCVNSQRMSPLSSYAALGMHGF